jgi:formylglycine-generating enzyme required for sulfatase activity
MALAAALAISACGGEEPVARTLPEVPPDDTLFVEVGGGSYLDARGDTVTVDAFLLCRYETTNRLYLSIARSEGLPEPPDPGFRGMRDYLWERPSSPVVNVSAVEAAKAAGAVGCRLPTAEELVWAASLPEDPADPYPWGELPPEEAGGAVNWLAGDDWESRGDDGYPWTAPVGSFPLSDRGLADITGNVAEWTASGDSAGRLVHGGSWLSESEDVRTRSLQRLFPTDRSWHTGFRLARDL